MIEKIRVVMNLIVKLMGITDKITSKSGSKNQ